MANDREQKIRDVYEAMRKTPLPLLSGDLGAKLEILARAAVDVLDPVKRIELSGGFYAEPPEQPGSMHRLYLTLEDGQKCYHGPMTGLAVEAWAAAAQEAKAIGACVEIREAMQSAEALDAIKAQRP